MSILAFWLLFLGFVGAFAAQVARRVQLIVAAPNTISFDNIPFRVRRFLTDVVFQVRTIRERPLAGGMHAFVFWGFVAFGGYPTVGVLGGLGIVDLTHTARFATYRLPPPPRAPPRCGGLRRERPH